MLKQQLITLLYLIGIAQSNATKGSSSSESQGVDPERMNLSIQNRSQQTSPIECKDAFTQVTPKHYKEVFTQVTPKHLVFAQTSPVNFDSAPNTSPTGEAALTDPGMCFILEQIFHSICCTGILILVSKRLIFLFLSVFAGHLIMPPSDEEGDVEADMSNICGYLIGDFSPLSPYSSGQEGDSSNGFSSDDSAEESIGHRVRKRRRSSDGRNLTCSQEQINVPKAAAPKVQEVEKDFLEMPIEEQEQLMQGQVLSGVIACTSAQIQVPSSQSSTSQSQPSLMRGEELEEAKENFLEELSMNGTKATSVTQRDEWLAIPETDRDIVMCLAGRFMKCTKCPDRKRHYYYDRSNAMQHVRIHFSNAFNPCPVCKNRVYSCTTRNGFNAHVVRCALKNGKKGYETQSMVHKKFNFYKFPNSHYDSYIVDMRKNAVLKAEIDIFRKKCREARQRERKKNEPKNRLKK